MTVSAAHGGLITSLTDTLGSLALASKGHFMTGVSTDIGTSFVRPAGRAGDILHAKAVLTGMGRSRFSSLIYIPHANMFYAICRQVLSIHTHRFHESGGRASCVWV